MPLRRPQAILHGRLPPPHRTPASPFPLYIHPLTKSPQLNTSLLGETLLSENRTSSNPHTNLLDKIPNAISSAINDRIGDLTAKLGIEDFYSAHMLDYCYGQYTPLEVANATIAEKDISKNVTGCSQSEAMYKFDPTRIVQDALNKTVGNKITLEDLKWPEDIDTGIRALNALMAAMFVLYVVAICLIFVALLASLFSVFAAGRLSACANVVASSLAFIAIGLASALVTAVVVKATGLVNEYGNDVGVVANKGSKFLALTWAATGVMFVAMVVWIVEVCVGRRQKSRGPYAKEG
jgi:hypothetical protein